MKTLRRIVKKDDFMPTCYQDIVGEILVTSYLFSQHSGDDTNKRAEDLAKSIGSHHFRIGIDEAYNSIVNIFKTAT